MTFSSQKFNKNGWEIGETTSEHKFNNSTLKYWKYPLKSTSTLLKLFRIIAVMRVYGNIFLLHILTPFRPIKDLHSYFLLIQSLGVPPPKKQNLGSIVLNFCYKGRQSQVVRQNSNVILYFYFRTADWEAEVFQLSSNFSVISLAAAQKKAQNGGRNQVAWLF